jgi:hypothetical protein
MKLKTEYRFDRGALRQPHALSRPVLEAATKLAHERAYLLNEDV